MTAESATADRYVLPALAPVYRGLERTARKLGPPFAYGGWRY